MKKQTLSPAVLASLTAAGLVLAPAAAVAQDADTQSVSLSDAETTPTATPTAESEEKQQSDEEQTSDESPQTDDQGPPEETSPDPTPSPQPSGDDEDSNNDGADDEGDSGEPTEESTPTEEPSEEPTPSEDPTSEPTQDPEPAEVTVQDVDLSDVVFVSGEEEPAGATITGTELEPSSTYEMAVTGGPEASAPMELTTDGDGTFEETYTIAADAEADLESYAGDRTVTVTDPSSGETLDQGSFEIIDDLEDDADQADPALDVPSSIEVDDVMVPQGEDPGDRGLQIGATGLVPGEQYTLRVVAPDDTADLSAEFEVDADENGTAAGSYSIEWFGDYNADVIAGTYTIELVGDDEVLDSADVEFTAGADDGDDSDDGEDEDDGDNGDDSDENDDPGNDEDADDDETGQPGEDDGDSDDADLDPRITVSPENLSAAAFMDYGTGVQVAAANCLPGDMVSLEVHWPGTDDVAYADGIEADDDGAAEFSFYGTGSNASDYVGTWTVSITCGGETVSDSFTVTGSTGDDSDGGSELPRTGTDASILAVAAAGLLTVGAATVMLSSRPTRRDTH